MSPSELADLTLFDYNLKCAGFIEARKTNESYFRKLAWIIFAVNADPKEARGMTIDNVWPISGQTVKKQGFNKKKVNTMIAKFIKMNPNKTLK